MSASVWRSEGYTIHESEVLEDRLRILLESLEWSYVVLWTLNPQTRVFEWTRGCFSQALDSSPAGSSSTVWDAQLFYSTYKSCSFAPGAGAVGRANLEGKHIWLTGDAVCQNAVSLDQSQYLRCTNIQSMMCIPWVDSVLEIGTTKLVQKNFPLMDQIQQVLSNDLLEPDPDFFEQAPSPTASGSTMFQAQLHPDSFHSEHTTNLPLPQQPSSNRRSNFQCEFSLSDDQVWRSGDCRSNLSLSSDAFMQVETSAIDSDSPIHVRAVKESLPFTLETGESQMRPIGSSSSSSLDHQLQHHHQIHATSPSSPFSSAHDDNNSTPCYVIRTSSSPAREVHSQLASPLNVKPARIGITRNSTKIKRTTSCRDQHEIQTAISLFEAQEMQDQWRLQSQLQLRSASPHDGRSPSPASQCDEYVTNLMAAGGQNTLPIQSTDLCNSSRPSLSVKRSSNASIMNQVSKVAGPLLRMQSLSAVEVLKGADILYQKKASEDIFNGPHELKVHQMTCEDPSPSHGKQIDTGAPDLMKSDRRRGLEHVGSVHAGHDEAAVNHMMAERRRRVKQKENFTALRKLVPIISKADKASTLLDAITYLRHLQCQIQDMEASNEGIDHQCQSLEDKCKELEERNRALVEAVISKDHKPSSAVAHLNLLKRLHTMKST